MANAQEQTYSEVFNKVNSPADVKKLSVEEMNILSSDIRKAILNRVDTIGGHLGPDLGIVEATIAMHYVFNSPKDKFIFDVSHQIYPHKILTGRKDAFVNPLAHPEISGYSNPHESEHDNFILGHTSTSLSLATGMAKARDLKGEKYNVVALIGDGSLSGGEAFEGLSNAAVLNSNMIIVVNDNVMSIAPVEGGIYNSLKILRDTNGQAKDNIFKSMGYDYYYLEDGNDVEKLIAMFKAVKDTNKPTVVHIHTLKGKGYEPAETDKETYHWHLPHFMDKNAENQTQVETYTSITNDYLVEKAKKDKALMVVSPATPGATGLTPDVRAKLGKHYTDVQIAEQHAVGYISGLAYNGAKPVLEVLSSFIQRSYDQMSQDMAINNAPATILVFWGGISSADVTHLQVFDIPLISNIPNIVYLAPTNKEEYLAMLDWSVDQNKYPVAIRVPMTNLVSTGVKDKTDYSNLNKFKFANKGEKVAIIGVGNFYQLGEQVQAKLKEQGINATLINPVYLTGLDEQALDELKANHDLVITLEDGVLDGGYGEKIARYYGNSGMKVLNFGAKKEFTDRTPMNELNKRYHLTTELIVKDIENLLKTAK
ncbi:MAG: 1-deoxy-D-xylulose-5-phosphate synthase [Candidatus Melainabacteria bacterium]|nr:MAG: 1-deoxy-D-xylulose-5-phosphate synthase [Candidatus Melainabacteria bacterium]